MCLLYSLCISTVAYIPDIFREFLTQPLTLFLASRLCWKCALCLGCCHTQRSWILWNISRRHFVQTSKCFSCPGCSTCLHQVSWWFIYSISFVGGPEGLSGVLEFIAYLFLFFYFLSPTSVMLHLSTLSCCHDIHLWTNPTRDVVVRKTMMGWLPFPSCKVSFVLYIKWIYQIIPVLCMHLCSH